MRGKCPNCGSRDIGGYPDVHDPDRTILLCLNCGHEE